MTDQPKEESLTVAKFLPAPLRRKAADRPGLMKILDNVAWLLLDKILQLGVGLLVGVWVARYLGPEQFGSLNYVVAFISLFAAVGGLGLREITTRDLVHSENQAGTTLGTAFALQLLGGFVAYVLLNSAIAWLHPTDTLIRSLSAVLGLTLILRASEVIRCWFEARVQSRYVVWAENSILLTMAAAKVFLITLEAPLIIFSYIMLAEAGLVSLALFVVYCQHKGPKSAWMATSARARTLLKDSFPLMLSAIAIMIYMRIDQIMLGKILGQDAVGIYSAALRISEIWYAVPIAISASAFPAIIESKRKNEALYGRSIQKLLDLMATLSLAIGLLTTLLASYIVPLLYGHHYDRAIPVLMIHGWAGLFVFMGVAGSKWYLVENLQYTALYQTLAGAVLNILLNLFLIPKYGAIGAAIATLISYGTAAYLLDALFKKTRPLFRAKTRSIFFGAYRILKTR